VGAGRTLYSPRFFQRADGPAQERIHAPLAPQHHDGHDDDRLFVRDGFRHYRRRYSLTEVRWGWACLAGMVLIAAWVAWRGRHPVDPNLFSDGAALLEVAKGAGPKVKVDSVASGPMAPPASTPAEPTAAAPAGRGPLPAGLGGADWNEDKILTYDEDNLYEKIDGRADYFRAFHFKRLHSLLLTSRKDSAVTVDVEMYDVSNAANALGAYSGERPPDAKVQVTDAGLHHFDRNALYLARGPYYIRVIGSDETPLVAEKLKQVAEKMIADVGGEPLPWAYGLYIGQLGFGADKITYSAKNAFSLAFADDVWAVRPQGKQTDLELFVSARGDAAAARRLADQLRKSFLELGQAAGKAGGAALVKDQFLGLYSGATTQDGFVLGVRGADSPATAGTELDRLRKALAGAPQSLLQRAVPAAATRPAPAGVEKDTGTKPAGGAESRPSQEVEEK
jgi:hypothetical protein